MSAFRCLNTILTFFNWILSLSQETTVVFAHYYTNWMLLDAGPFLDPYVPFLFLFFCFCLSHWYFDVNNTVCTI